MSATFIILKLINFFEFSRIPITKERQPIQMSHIWNVRRSAIQVTHQASLRWFVSGLTQECKLYLSLNTHHQLHWTITALHLINSVWFDKFRCQNYKKILHIKRLISHCYIFVCNTVLCTEESKLNKIT